jgi:hypothetical protein
MGDFEVVNVNGRLQKNGGNVASYFCTPEGRVIHAVGRPVQPEKLLQEARWALDTYERALQVSSDPQERVRFVEASHLAALNSDHTRFASLVQNELGRANDEYWSSFRSHRQQPRGRWQSASYRPPEILRVPPEVTARRRAANRLGGDQAHRILAAQPMAPLAQVYRPLFEKLTGERANDRRGLVYRAAEGLQHARENKLPLLIVAYDGRGENREEFDSAMERLVANVFNHPTAAQPLNACAVVAVPIRQMPALSNLADLPVYQLPSGSRPALIVAEPTGEPIASLPGSTNPDQLASHLWPEVHESWLVRAERLATDDKNSQSLRLLRQIQRTSSDSSIDDRATRQINDVRLKLADKWANRGSTRSARRLLESVRESALRFETRALAERRISELNGTSFVVAARTR